MQRRLVLGLLPIQGQTDMDCSTAIRLHMPRATACSEVLLEFHLGELCAVGYERFVGSESSRARL